jgi:PAS domain S-box-containing protein
MIDRENPSARGGATGPDATLRARAEEAVGRSAGRAESTPEDGGELLLYELRVHQIELEMQNDELRRTQEALEASRERYFDLYDLAPVGYFTIGENGSILEANLTAAAVLGVPRSSLVQRRFVELICREDQDVYYLYRRALCESGAPQSCELRLVRGDSTVVWVQAEGTVSPDGEPGDRVYRTTISDIGDLKRAEEALRAAAERLRETLHETIRAMGEIMSMRDPYTVEHQRRAARLADAIAVEMDLDDGRREGLRLAGEVYEVGKLGIPVEILNKPGALTPTERGVMQQHARAGRDILAGIAFEQPVATIVGQHHERLDGSGYPEGLKGAEILLESRVLAVADIVAAMTADRPYRPAHSVEHTLAHVRAQAVKLLDPAVVAACEGAFQKGFGFDEGQVGRRGKAPPARLR